MNTLQFDCREEVAHPDLISVDFIDHTVTFSKSDPSRYHFSKLDGSHYKIFLNLISYVIIIFIR